MRPLNYAILKLFEDGREFDVQGVITQLQDEYSSFRAFKPMAINESLMSAEKNGLLEECNWELDAQGELHVYYKATPYGIEMIHNYIK
ncbi:MAG: hypothetical protein FWE41_06150 [Coriobacteriia bacterium]|nr:hypothetical protein [Coriobacteriia bacterium]MCL2750028.1 hypothetical protein [Coriobacteriia bacterium]